MPFAHFSWCLFFVPAGRLCFQERMSLRRRRHLQPIIVDGDAAPVLLAICLSNGRIRPCRAACLDRCLSNAMTCKDRLRDGVTVRRWVSDAVSRLWLTFSGAYDAHYHERGVARPPPWPPWPQAPPVPRCQCFAWGWKLTLHHYRTTQGPYFCSRFARRFLRADTGRTTLGCRAFVCCVAAVCVCMSFSYLAIAL